MKAGTVRSECKRKGQKMKSKVGRCREVLLLLLVFSLVIVSFSWTSFAENSPEEEPHSYNTTKQLTEEDILEMNNGSAVFSYSEDGYLTTLIGKYYDKPVHDVEEAILSLNGIASLLGLSAGAEFFAVYGSTDIRGYTYYTLEQRLGSLTIYCATLKIVLDPEGYPVAVSSSLVPNVGYEEDRPSITDEEAAEAVRWEYAGESLTFYPEATDHMAIVFEGQTVNCVVVYTNNPDVSPSFDMPYLAHFVAFEGSYLSCTPTSSLTRQNTDVWKTEDYFEGLVPDLFGKTVTMVDGTRKTLILPVAYNPSDGLYYLADMERHIIFADYPSFAYGNELDFWANSDKRDWPDYLLLAYDNFIKVYDFYAERGIYSVDGFGIPILVTSGLCEPDGTPQDNACYYGINNGWACFGITDINHYAEGLDVIGHEFTHGVTTNSMQGMIYENYAGAINESYCDIMGNLIEEYYDQSEEDWLIAEDTGTTLRSMSSPIQYDQPEYAGDVYFIPAATSPGRDNDNGGVHVNSSLTNRVAYQIHEAGLPVEDQIRLWGISIEMLTPRATYNDLCAVLMGSAKILGLGDVWEDRIYDIFKENGLIGQLEWNALSAKRPGCARVSFRVPEEYADSSQAFYLTSSFGYIHYETFPSPSGLVTILAPATEYALVLEIREKDGTVTDYVYAYGDWYPISLVGLPLTSLSSGDSLVLKSFNGAPELTLP